MLKVILTLTTILFFTQAAIGSAFVGGYQVYTDLSSAEFIKVRNTINQAYPQVSDWTIKNVSRQLVNGFNYAVVLESLKGQIGQVKVYNTFSGDITVYALTITPATSTAASTLKVVQPIKPVQVPTSVLLSASNDSIVFNNSSDPNYKKALQQALSQNIELSQFVLGSTELQIIDAYYFKFTFQSLIGPTKTVLSAVALQDKVSNISQNQSGNVNSYLLLGGYKQLNLNDTDAYSSPLKQLYKSQKYLSTYTLISVQRQVVAGTNYLFVLQNDVKIEKVCIRVFIDLKNVATVTLTQTVNARGYQQKLIQQIIDRIYIQKPELKNYSIATITNLWQNGEGLKIIFELGNSYVQADQSIEGGRQKLIIYQL